MTLAHDDRQVPLPPAQRPVRLHAIGLHACEPWWRLGPERTTSWPDLDLWLLLEGHGTVQTPEGQRDLRPGACLVLRGGEPYTFVPDAQRRFRHWYAHFSFCDVHGRDEPPQTRPPARFRQLDAPHLLTSLLQRTADAWSRDDPTCHSWLAAALLEVEHADAAHERADDPWHRTIAGFVARIRADPAQAPTVAAMAAEAGFSCDHFTRVFRSATGQTPRSFIVEARLARARHLLRDSTLGIGRITESCGFADPAFFGRHFLQHHGVSPGAWRQRRQG
jgi:AraC-like DNA-binding protein